MLRNHTLHTVLAVALILGAGLPAWHLWASARPAPPTPPPIDVGPVPVRVRTPAPRDVELVVEAYGTLLPAREVVVALEVAGRVTEVHAGWRPGGEVRHEDVLVALDPEPYRLAAEASRAAEAEAQARLALARTERGRAKEALEKAVERTQIAQREVERRETLEASGSGSEVALDRARAELVTLELAERDARGALAAAIDGEAVALAGTAAAAAAVAQAVDTETRTSFAAPFDGRFVGRAPEVGTFVPAGVPLGELVDVGGLHLSLLVVEDDLAGVEVGQPATVDLPSRPGERFAGRVRAVAPRGDPGARAFAVEVEVAPGGDAEGAAPILAGQFARARVGVGTVPAALTVARAELAWLDGAPHVFVVEGDIARARRLALGRAVGEGFVVEDGLAPGDVLAVHPLDRLFDGAPVLVEEPPPDGGDDA